MVEQASHFDTFNFYIYILIQFVTATMFFLSLYRSETERVGVFELNKTRLNIME